MARNPRKRTPNRRSRPIEQLPWGQPKLRKPYTEIISEDEVAAIHQTSLRILEEIGIVFHDDEACALFRKAGAQVAADGTVRIGRDIVDAALKTVKDDFWVYARNPAHNVRIGGGYTAFASVLGPPNVSCLDHGRRSGTLEDYGNLIRLAQYFNIIHMVAGSPVEPNDIEVNLRHIEAVRLMLKLTDKVPYLFSQGRQRLWDGMELVARALGYEDREGLKEKPRLFSIINTNSPLQYDSPMASGVIELARHNQMAMIAPFSLAGATMPLHLAGAIAQSNAEALAGVTLAQIVRPGAPLTTAAKTVATDMKTGAPAFATPESNKAVQIGAQLARYNKIPFRAANFNNSNALDGQAMYESQGALWAAVTGGTDSIMQAAGWMEGGLCASFEKYILDIEILQMISVWLDEVPVNAETLDIEEIRSVGAGGHFFGTERTIAGYEDAFYKPMITNTLNFEAWEEAGAKDAAMRANSIWKQALAEYAQPELNPEHEAAMEAFAERRLAEGGAPID